MRVSLNRGPIHRFAAGAHRGNELPANFRAYRGSSLVDPLVVAIGEFRLIVWKKTERIPFRIVNVTIRKTQTSAVIANLVGLQSDAARVSVDGRPELPQFVQELAQR